MLRELLKSNGEATVEQIAKALLSHDRSQVEYYEIRTKNMVGNVLTNNGVVVAKTGDEDSVHKKYRGANGRREILNLVTGTARGHIKSQLIDFTEIISVWRDEAGHGAQTEISTANADEALRQLLHMCQWCAKEWSSLTG